MPLQYTISSMTGFARTSGECNGVAWIWETRSVNGKGLDVRLRLPLGYDRLEQAAKALVTAAFKRGSIQINLMLTEAAANKSITINEALLEQLAGFAENLRAKLGGPAVDVCQLLNVKGVVEVSEASLEEEQQATLDKQLLGGLETALNDLASARREEGARLALVMSEQLASIESLAESAQANPSRRPEVIAQRLREQLQRILETGVGLDQQRLHQEAALLATKADIQEEIDRLRSHVVAARQLLKAGEPVGRKMDFLVQEFNREANTLCSKSSDASLTSVGLDLKAAIDQLREQIQNIE
jgi:uncharacterized protein (TIGR00255 family)